MIDWAIVAWLGGMAVAPWVLMARYGRDEPETLDTWRARAHR